MKRLFVMAIGFVQFAGISIALFVAVVLPFDMYEKARAESWPSRKGIITHSVARQEFDFSMGRGGSPYWEADICGTYLDTGGEFCIRRVSLGLHIGDQTRASVLQTVTRYPIGRKVDVFHSPDKPAKTILEPHSSWYEMYIALGISIILLLLPVFLHFFRRGTGATMTGDRS